jgi:tetratricopeptide (TPR) repeat protein
MADPASIRPRFAVAAADAAKLKTAAARAAAALTARVRAPEGIFAQRWVNAATPDEPPAMDLNALPVLTTYWVTRDPELAAELVRSAFSGQDPDGGLCRRIGPDGEVLEASAPWPRLLAGARPACAADPDLREWMVPHAEAWLHWAGARYDPGGEGRFCWPAPEESLLPQAWDENLASVGLTSLLCAECEAFRAILGEGGSPADPHALHTLETRLQEALSAQRDDTTGTFRDRYADGRAVQRLTLPVCFPLLLDGTPEAARATLAAELSEGPLMCSSGGFSAWEPWPGDPAAPPAPVALQPPALEALGRIDPETAARQRATLGLRLARAWETNGVLPDDLGGGGAGRDTPVAEALLADALEPTHTPLTPPWIERHRRTMMVLLLALLVLPVAIIFGLAHRRITLPASTMESIISLGRQHLATGHAREAEALLRDFIRRTGNPPGAAHLWLGNALFRQGRFEEAEAEYRIGLNDEVSSLHALYNLGLTLHRLGRLDEAIECFDAFIEAYEQDLPALVGQARRARMLIREQQRAAAQADRGAGLIHAP